MQLFCRLKFSAYIGCFSPWVFKPTKGYWHVQKEASDSRIGNQSWQTATSTDAVMITFQQTMLQMTSNFLQTQQKVMLAYLHGKSVHPSQHAQWLPMSSQKPEMLLQPIHPAMDFRLPGAVQVNLEETATASAENETVNLGSSAPENGNTPSFANTNVVCDAPAHRVRTTDELIGMFIELVSERTGYPSEMLDPALDLESDLGIDSIKRVEIFSNFKRLLPEGMQEALEGDLEELGGLQTLEAISDWIRKLPIAAQAEVTNYASDGA